MTGRDATAGRDRPVREGLHAVPGQGVPQGILNRRVQERREISMMSSKNISINQQIHKEKSFNDKINEN